MGNKIQLNGHTSITKSQQVFETCKRLFANTEIDYFCYLRRYKDGRFTFLPSMIDFGSYLFEDGAYPDSWFAGVPFDDLQSGCSFWDLARPLNSDETTQISDMLTKCFKLSTGIEILFKEEDYCDFYSFSGSSPALYLTPIATLYQFIYYFKQQLQILIIDANHDCLLLHEDKGKIAPMPIVELSDSKTNGYDDTFPVKRYYLNGKHEGLFLTKREVEILCKLNQGLLVKNLAETIHLSTRTVEKHIANIKAKLNLQRITELLRFARDEKLIV